ncbi:MAG: DUF1302 family protein [Halioglobus sp.]
MNNKFLLATLVFFPSGLHALDFEFNNGITIALDSTVTYGAQWRVESPHSDLLANQFLADLQDDPLLGITDPRYAKKQTLIVNGDDGNNNFDTGLISNRITYLLEMDATWQSYGLFVRGRAFYDEVYKNSDTDLDAVGFITYNSGTAYGGEAGIGDFPSKTRDEHGSVVEFLDVFVYATWELPGERLMDLRLGRQVINWGESTFYQGINSIQNRADARAANTPGVEIKEILLPTGAIYTQLDLVESLTLEAYYQYEWLANELNGVGSYFSTTDQIGPGANAFLIPSPGLPFVPEDIRGNEFHLAGVPRTPDEEPSDDGQWGMALHYVTDNQWDIGAYYVVGHDKKPSFVLEYIDVPGAPAPVPVSYYQRYFEDIKGSALSATTVIGNTNIQGELSWLDGTPMVNAVGDPERENLLKLQLGGSHVFGPSIIADDIALVFEGFYASVESASARDLIADDTAIGYSLLSTLSYNNVLSGWDMAVPIYFKHDVSGVINELQVFGGARVLSVGVEGIYLNNLTTTFSYAVYFGGEPDYLLRDRDNVALTIKYSF